jgi:nucleoside-diphosphate-sugar epimerase
MPSILITGGAGYLGSILVPALLDAGHHVTVVDSFRWGQESLNALCFDPRFEVVRGDARNTDVVIPLLAKADYVIPLAALVGAPLCDRDPEAAWSTNYGAIKGLLEAASPEQRFIFPNTNSGYGVGQPGKECDEETPLKPISIYGQTKCAAELLVLERRNAVTFRLATVFGASPRHRTDLLLNEFVWKAVSERSIVLFQQDFMRNFCHVRDVARAFLHAIDNFEKMRGNTFNVGDSRANMSKRQLCERIKLQIPNFHFMEAPIAEDPDKRDYIVSNEKMERTGWVPAYSIDDGFRELIKLYQCFRKYQCGNV